jgi:hypothetical protein
MYDMENEKYKLSYFNDAVTITGFKDGVNFDDLLIESEVSYLCPRHDKLETHEIDRIGAHAFENHKLQKVTFDPNMGTFDILDYAFADNKEMEINQSPFSVIWIWKYAFYNCYKINNLEFPNVYLIQDSSFENCVGLESIIIGEKITSIGDFCFKNCNDNLSVTLLTAIPPKVGKGIFDGVDNLIIRIPKDSMAAYLTNEDWMQYKDSLFELA